MLSLLPFQLYKIPLTRPLIPDLAAYKLTKFNRFYSDEWTFWFTSVVILLCNPPTIDKLNRIMNTISGEPINSVEEIYTAIQTRTPTSYNPIQSQFYFSEL